MNRIEAVIGGMKMVRGLTWKEAKAQGEREARKEIRRAIAPALRDVKWYLSTPTEETPAKQGARDAVRAIDAATKPKRPGAKR